MSDCLDGADEQWYDSNTPDDVSDDCQLCLMKIVKENQLIGLIVMMDQLSLQFGFTK